MGLGMITAIRQFDEDRNESVNMRVRFLFPFIRFEIFNFSQSPCTKMSI